jgi:hypothetical protein
MIDYRDKLSILGKSCAQVYQDVFALTINEFKKDGFYLDIGCGGPYGKPGCSNTELLRRSEYNWAGVSIDMTDWSKEYNKIKNNKFYKIDATDKKQLMSCFENVPSVIDYLSLDIDDYTIDALKILDFDNYKFRCITIEHNKYLGSRGEQRHEQRIFLQEKGYYLLVKNLHQFEDWWVNPELVDIEKIKHLETLSESTLKFDEVSVKNDLNKIKQNYI